MEEKNKLALASSNLIEEQVLNKVNSFVELGMVLPEGTNPVNSLKKVKLILNDMKVGGKPALEVCTKESILNCLMEIVVKGYDVSDLQAYLIPRQNTMTVMESVYGRIARAKRASKHYKPRVCYVHESDVFEYGIDTETGLTKVYKHETSLENKDKPIVGAYTYVTDNDGVTDIFIMTKKSWLRSWAKSPNGCALAKDFEEDMIYRTIIKKSTKALVNSNTKNISIDYSSTEDDDDTPLAGNVAPAIEAKKNFTDFEEVPATEAVDLQAEAIKPEPKKQGRPAKEAADKPKEEVKTDAPVVKDEDDF